MAFAAERRDAFCNTFQCTPRDYGPLPGFEITGVHVLVVHPLWDTFSPHALLASAHAAAPAGEVRYLDTFNLLRRESWSYQTLAG